MFSVFAVVVCLFVCVCVVVMFVVVFVCCCWCVFWRGGGGDVFLFVTTAKIYKHGKQLIQTAKLHNLKQMLSVAIAKRIKMKHCNHDIHLM